MKMIVRVATLLVFIIGSAVANPIIDLNSSKNNTKRIYTFAEDLKITLDEDVAYFSGNFRFRDYIADFAMLRISVWLSAQLEHVQTNEVGMTVNVNGRKLEYDNIKKSKQKFHLRSRNSFDERWKLDVGEVFYYVDMGRPHGTNNDCNVTLEYMQPLIKSEGRSLLYYVPYLSLQPVPSTGEKPYMITVRCPTGFRLIPISTNSYHQPPTQTELVISPKDREPVLIELVREDPSSDVEQSKVESQEMEPHPTLAASSIFPEKRIAALPPCDCGNRTNLNLEYTYWCPCHAYITVNGKLCSAGETVHGFKIISVTEDDIVFLCPVGHALKLERPTESDSPLRGPILESIQIP